jgi:hypothetical protein
MNGAPRLELLLDLETRHEDLLDRLDELDKRVEKVLAAFPPRRDASGDVAASRSPQAAG